MTIEAGAQPATSKPAETAPKKFNWSRLIAYVAIGVAIGYAYDNWDTVSTQYLGFPYTCQNMATELTTIPPASAVAPRLIGIVDRIEMAATPERVECTGVGLYANGTRVPLKYRAWQEGGQWWLQYEPAV